jgi:cytochrome c oxidase assembly protein subunit 15
VPVSSAVVSRLSLANAVANGLIVETGGAVRLTGSGLG